MKRSDIEHTLRAAGEIMAETQFIIVGSQSILGKFPNAPEELLMSKEVDMFAKNKPLLSYKLDVIGVGSEFDKTHGYYVDPVGEETAVLPQGWKSRLVNLSSAMTKGVTGLCLDPHDLFVSKMVAGREKDFEYCKVMIEHNLVGKDRVLALAATLANTLEDPERNARIIRRIEGIYQGVDLSKTIHVDEQSGFYTGKVTSVSKTVVQQDVGRGKVIFHQLDKLDGYPIVGRSYDIKYKDGSASMTLNSPSKDKGPTR